MAHKPQQSGPISVNAYAKLRKVTARAVRKAIEEGRLKVGGSVVMVETRTGKAQPKIADIDLADKEWAANTQGCDSPGDTDNTGEPGDPADYAEARFFVEIQKWHQAKIKTTSDRLDLDLKTGKLIDTEISFEDIQALLSNVRAKLLGVPSKCRGRIRDLSPDDVVIIDDLIREALEDLAGEG